MRGIRGITLVALVITIIVLLILAGIAINLTVGNNGLFIRAKDTANTWKKAEQNEHEEIQNFENTYDNIVNDLGLSNTNTIAECTLEGHTVKFTVGTTWRESIGDIFRQVREQDSSFPEYYIQEEAIYFNQSIDSWKLNIVDGGIVIVHPDDKIIQNAIYALYYY